MDIVKSLFNGICISNHVKDPRSTPFPHDILSATKTIEFNPRPNHHDAEHLLWVNSLSGSGMRHILHQMPAMRFQVHPNPICGRAGRAFGFNEDPLFTSGTINLRDDDVGWISSIASERFTVDPVL